MIARLGACAKRPPARLTPGRQAGTRIRRDSVASGPCDGVRPGASSALTFRSRSRMQAWARQSIRVEGA